MIDLITLWFKRAKPTSAHRDLEVQMGAHFEEVHEMLETVQGKDDSTELLLKDAREAMKKLATALKSGTGSVGISDRKEYLDACCDQIVTAVGSAHFAGMQIVEAVGRVNSSNWSKFDDNGQPIFDAKGKIAKGPRYAPPDLEGLY